MFAGKTPVCKLYAMSGNDMPTANANPPVQAMIDAASNTSMRCFVSDENFNNVRDTR